MILLAPNHRRSFNPAQCAVTGGISNGADWIETLIIVDQDGAQVTGVGSDTWKIQLRSDQDETAADLTLTTGAGGELTITVGATTTLAINATADAVGALDPGDYVIDIASQTSGGVTTHRAHGKIRVSGSPLAF